MDWGTIIAIGVILFCLISLFTQAVLASRDQARALKAGEAVGSLWHHMVAMHRRREAEKALKEQAQFRAEVNQLRALSIALPVKPVSADKPKPLSSAQRKQLGLPKPARSTFSVIDETPPVRTAADFGMQLVRDEDKDFSHLHPDQVSPQAVTFLYENSQGETSRRDVTVNQVGTSHFAGMCHLEGAERTFRFDRIIGSVTLDSGLMLAPNKLRNHLRGYGEQELRHRRRAAAKVASEILFTGFKAERRAELEAQAVEAGMIVRKRVTLDLDFLCAGSNSGPAKLDEAKARGAVVLSAEQFSHLISTGEIPS